MNYKIIALIVTKGEKAIENSINSINSQTLLPDEIVISSEKDINPDCKLYVNSFNSSLSSNTQQALLKIYFDNLDFKGKVFVATLDDDDYWDNKWIEKVDSKIREGYNFITGNLEVIDLVGNSLEIRTPSDSLNYETYLYGNDGLQGSNKAFDLNLYLESGGMHKEIKASTDRILNINLSLHPETKYFSYNEVVAKYTYEKGSNTITNNPNRKSQLREFYNSYWNIIDKKQIQNINNRHLILHGFKEVIKWK